MRDSPSRAACGGRAAAPHVSLTGRDAETRPVTISRAGTGRQRSPGRPEVGLTVSSSQGAASPGLSFVIPATNDERDAGGQLPVLRTASLGTTS